MDYGYDSDDDCDCDDDYGYVNDYAFDYDIYDGNWLEPESAFKWSHDDKMS